MLLKQFKSYIKNNKYELLTSFLLFTNLFPKFFPQILYYISFILIINKLLRFSPKDYARTNLFYSFIAFLWVTTIIGMALDLRLIIFSTILYMCAPRRSLQWHHYKIKLLKNIFIGFGLATIANLFAKLLGINQIHIDEYSISIGRVAEFSGFCSHAMWTSASAAISAVFFINMAFRKLTIQKWPKFFYFIMAVISLYIVVLAGSRSAFVLALACSLLTIRMQSNKFSSLLKNMIIIAIAAFIFTPFIISNSKAMFQKKNAFEITVENTSRDELWAQRIAEFKSSPIIGIGFAAHGIGESKQVGRNESGGGYISVLAQTGIVGSIFIIIIMGSAYTFPRKIGTDPNIILIYCIFTFMVIHTIVEGYLFQGGWYLCLIIWLIIGVMIEYRDYVKTYIYNYQHYSHK